MRQAVVAQAGLVLPVSNLLALDQASHTSGFSVFKDGELVIASHFTFDDKDLGVRLEKIRNKIVELIKEYNITDVIFEDIQLQSHGDKEVGIKTFKILAEVFGVVYELLTELKINFTTVPPIVWKSTIKIAGKGRAQEKKLAQQYVKNKYNIVCTEDEADAICIGTHYLKKQASEFDWS